MKPTELRIGNYVQSVDLDTNELEQMEIISINSEGEGHYNYIDNFGNIYKQKIKDAGWFSGDCELIGIPLSDEWLMRFGFNGFLKRIKDTDLYLQGEEYQIDEFGNEKIQQGKWQVYISTDIGEGKVDDPKTMIEGYIYVHQIQNLYYALTGEELVLAVSPILAEGKAKNKRKRYKKA